MKKSGMMLMAAVATGLMAWGDTWYVDCKNYGKSGMDGKTEATAFGTIQEGADVASAGETVMVLPGVYNKGTSRKDASKDLTYSRLSITNAITVQSRDGAANTFIVGEADFVNEPKYGLGENAVRCVKITGKNAVLKGFTLTGGYVNQSTGTDWQTTRGGGVNMDVAAKVVDCVISNNVATRGGGGYGGSFFRTLFKDNQCHNTGSTSTTRNGSACRTCSIYNCVVEGNGSSAEPYITVHYHMNAIVNCTMVGNNSYAFWENASAITVKNTIIENPGSIDGTKFSFVNSVTNGINPTAGVAMSEYPIAAAAFGDYRLVAGCDLLAAGDVSALNDIPAEERDTDFFGNPRKTGETVSIGAVEGSVTPAGGVMTVSSHGDTCIDGEIMYKNMYFHALEWPKQVYLTAKTYSDENYALYAFSITTNDLAYKGFPDRNGGRWMTMPVKGTSMTVAPHYAIRLRVDGSSQAETEDGSENAPYKTIQAAVDSCPSSYYRVIEVAEGDYYGTNSVYGSWGASSVLIRGRHIFLKATGRTAYTKIHGRKVDSTTGCGDGAARCIAIVGSSTIVGISGFTLLDGATKVGTSGSDSSGHGGSVKAEASFNAQILDSVITDCAATRGPGGFGGWYQRCLIKNCVDQSGQNATLRECVMSSCVLYDNTATHVIVGQNVKAYHCTGRGLKGRSNYYHVSSGYGCSVFNSLLIDGINNDSSASTSKYAGVFCDTTENVPSRSGFTKGLANVVSKENNDYRPFAFSNVLGGGETDGVDNFVAYTVSDFENKPIAFIDGKPTIGAYTHAVGAVMVSAAENVTISNVGTNALENGASITVSVTPTEKRNVTGIEVDGVEMDGVYSYSFEGAYDGVAHTVNPIASGDWYVDATDGDDGNYGFAATSAKKTLASVMRYVLPGDTVHAAEGIYRDGEMTGKRYNADVRTIRSRVVVTNSVTLVASGDVTKTIIMGDKASTPSEQGENPNTNIGSYQYCFEQYGMGTNAMRCVTLYGGATIRGFTLTGGRTGVYVAEKTNYEEANGAGVLAFGENSIVDGCVFTNNYSCRATVSDATIRRCVFKDNYAAWNCPVARYSWLSNVLAVENIGNPICDDCKSFYNCTFASNYAKPTRASTACYLFTRCDNKLNVPFVNSILIQDASSTGNVFGDVRNSIFLDKVAWSATNVNENAETVASIGEILDANYCPIKGSKAMDAGATAFYPADAGDTDLRGVQRVYNGGIDIGAIEYDWRGDYAKTLGGNRMTVNEATGEVKLNAGKVEIPSGRMVASVVRRAGRDTDAYHVKFAVTGNGVLTVSGFGEDRTYTLGDYDLQLDSAADPLALMFAYAPGENDAGAALIERIKAECGMVITIR